MANASAEGQSQMGPPLPSPIQPDQPLEDPGQDVLGYAPFAKNLAAAIFQLPSGRGIVLAIYGPWGSGKTTVVNFVRHYLEENPQGVAPIYFNPWWFPSPEYLTRQFFETLTDSLKGSESY
jgi:predicted KAP-like P-loop ATPase